MLEKLNQEQKEKWQKKGFEQFTRIQTSVFDKICAGENIVGISKTGTGKTLAYVLPVLQKVEKNNQLQSIILTSSQELAQQTAMTIREWGTGITVQVIAGGANIKRQVENLKKKPEIIVATPGRLLDLSNQSKKIKYHTVKTIIIDEADYLLSKEHLSTVRELIKKLQTSSQMILFSATEIDMFNDTDKWFGKKCTIVKVMDDNTIKHGYVIVESRKRGEMLKKIVYHSVEKIIVFVNNIATLDTLYDKLQFEQIHVSKMHSDISHVERQKQLIMFKNNDTNVLLTTDISARGLDIPKVPLVIQYDLPWEKTIYTHRAGRTGRMQQKGVVLSLVSKEKIKEYYQLLPKDVRSDEYVLNKGECVKRVMSPK